MEVLIAEDEQSIANTLLKSFAATGNHAVIVGNGEEVLDAVKKIKFDVILLDWRMPKMTGLQVCRQLRELQDQTPIILLTALTEIANKVEALNAGADDYITKPFSFEEVLARINAVLRRFQSNTNSLPFGNFILNLITHSVEMELETVKLSEKEFELLKFFLLNKGTIISKEVLCEKIWDIHYPTTTNFVEVTVKNLRKKLEDFTSQKFIRTVYGEGYIFFAD